MLGCPSWHVGALQLCVALFTFAAGFRRRFFSEFWSVCAEKKHTILMASGSCLLWMQSWRCSLQLSLPRLQALTFARWFVQSSVPVMLCTRVVVLQKPRPSLPLSQYFGTVRLLRIGPLPQLKKSPSLQKGHLLSVVLQAASRLLRQLFPLVVECTAVPENDSRSTWVSALGCRLFPWS